ncbi:MAG: Hsp20/alpha crystallin family protein [Thermodesulfovibrionales bacterium]
MPVKKSRELVKRGNSSPITPFSDLEHWFEDIWKRPFSMLRPPFWPDMKVAETYEISPSIDIYEEGNELIIKGDLPGIRKQDIKVDLTENVLTISGEKKKEEKVEREDYYRYERSFGSFCRRFEMPVDIDMDKVKAHFEDGVLEVRIPKTREGEKKHKKIAID